MKASMVIVFLLSLCSTISYFAQPTYVFVLVGSLSGFHACIFVYQLIRYHNANKTANKLRDLTSQINFAK